MKRNVSLAAMFLSGALAGIIIIMLVAFTNKSGPPEKNDPPSKEPVHTWYAPELPAKMDFAGEAVPLERWEIKEQLDREILYNYYWQHNILYIMKLSGRYFPLIEKQLREYNIPDDFKYLCIAESNLLNATSHAGAVGFWQFMKGTAPAYDIEVSATVDARYHVEKSTAAACKYLRQAYEKFGSWTAAAASYNCGMGGYNKNASFQGTKDYYDLLLPQETQRYIFRILAFKYLMTHSDALGFLLEDGEQYSPVKTRPVTVTTSIPDLAAFAREEGTTYRMLKLMNPWLRQRSLTVKPGKTYILHLPMEGATLTNP